MNIVFCGSPRFALPSLEALLQKHTILAVISQPSRPQGRGLETQANCIEAFARNAGLRVFTPERLLDIKEEVLALPIDILVVVAYGKLIPSWLLRHPIDTCINVHASLLPRWRGASPLQRALMTGDSHTGVSIMQLEKGMDTGGYWLQKSVPITLDTSIDTLHDQLALLGAESLVEVIDQKLYQTRPQPQNLEGITYAPKLTAHDFSYHPHYTIHDLQCRLRAFYPKPGIRATLRGEILRLLTSGAFCHEKHSHAPGTLLEVDNDGLWIATHDGKIAITSLQLASQPVRSVTSMRHGWPSILTFGHCLQPACL